MDQELKEGKLVTFTDLTVLVKWFQSCCYQKVIYEHDCVAPVFLPFYILCVFIALHCAVHHNSSCCMAVCDPMGQVFSLESPAASLELFLKRVIFISGRGIGFPPLNSKGIAMVFPPTIGSSWSCGPRSACLEALGPIKNYRLLSKLLKLEHSNRGFIASWIQSDPYVSFSAVECTTWNNLAFTLVKKILWCAPDGWNLINFIMIAVPWMF